jgi:hypothetical protein
MEAIAPNEEAKLVSNVSKEADAEFMRLLEKDQPTRYDRLMRNMRRDNPTARMSEDQALTNFMVGLPTGQHRFGVVAGQPAPEPTQAEPSGKTVGLVQRKYSSVADRLTARRIGTAARQGRLRRRKTAVQIAV